MKKKEKECSIALALIVMVLFLILVSSTASASIEKESIQVVAPTIIETRISTSGIAEMPDIYGDRIVYINTILGDGDFWTEMCIYNLSTKKTTQVPNIYDAAIPDIYGNRIGYLDGGTRFNPSGVYIYDLSTEKITPILAVYAGWGFGIYENKVVLEDTRDDEDWNNSDIYMYDLSTSTETQITTNESSQTDPAIYGDRIVWADERNGNLDIYMFNLSTSKETQITTSESNQEFPAIYGDKAVWTDYRNGNADIYMYDLSTSTEIQITTNVSDQTEPAIYGNRIVWTDSLNGNTDIYMGTISYLPVASFTASPTSGKAPLTVAFTDKSKGSPTKWKWSFGDGTTSTQQNLTHKYSKVGSYTVKLTATNDKGSNTVTKTDYIKVVTKPVAVFSAKPTSGKSPLTVSFTDKSSGIPTSWKWSFGDGKTSTDQNPEHRYLQEGNYTVKLTVTNTAGSSTKTKTNYIKVTTNTRPGIYSENK